MQNVGFLMTWLILFHALLDYAKNFASVLNFDDKKFGFSASFDVIQITLFSGINKGRE